MDALLFKVLLTPLLIGAASLAGRRWGPTISGWLIGLPFTSGPVAFFLVLEHGSAFAVSAATGTLAGTCSQAAFCLAYAWTAIASRRWPIALAAASGAFAVSTIALQRLAVPLSLIYALAIVALGLALRLMPPRPDPASIAAAAPPVWDLPARMAAATAVVLLLTGVAPALGPRLTGLVTPFPIFATILAVFAQRTLGAEAATGVLRGLLAGLFAFATFFLVLAALLARLELVAFAMAIAVALAVQTVSLWALRRAGH